MCAAAGGILEAAGAKAAGAERLELRAQRCQRQIINQAYGEKVTLLVGRPDTARTSTPIPPVYASQTCRSARERQLVPKHGSKSTKLPSAAEISQFPTGRIRELAQDLLVRRRAESAL